MLLLKKMPHELSFTKIRRSKFRKPLEGKKNPPQNVLNWTKILQFITTNRKKTNQTKTKQKQKKQKCKQMWEMESAK